MKFIIPTLGVAFVVFILAVTGTLDVQEQQRIEAQYIDMVCKGLWPDYNNLKPQC
jgi:hypothetical protein